MSLKPGYDTQPTFDLKRPLIEPNWTKIQSKKSRNDGLYDVNIPKLRKRKAKKNNKKLLNLSDMEIDDFSGTTAQNIDETPSSESEIDRIQDEFETRLKLVTHKIMTDSLIKTINSTDSSGTQNKIDSADTAQCQADLKLISFKKTKVPERSNVPSKPRTPIKKVRFSEKIDLIPKSEKNFSTRYFYPTAKSSKRFC